MSKHSSPPILIVLLGLAVAVSCVRYTPRPVTAAATLDDFEARRLDAPELAELAAKARGGPWPPAAWDLGALTLAALYYSPDLDVARAQWAAAEAARISAGERPNPTASVLMGYNVTSPVSEVTPWIPEAALEIPIETAGKRGYRIAQARHLSDAARLGLLSSAWEVRRKVRQSFLDLYAARETAALLETQRLIQTENVRILEAQLALGEAAASDVTQARMALDAGRLAAFDAEQERERAVIGLAAAIGVSPKALDGVPLSFDGFLETPPAPSTGEARRKALVNRADLLGALAEYAAADAALRLELAKQYPDLSLGPNYQLDQTDAKWTLGLSFVLPLLSRNKGPIAEAAARREEAAARFLALQAKVLSDLDAAAAACRSAAGKAAAADGLRAGLLRQEASAKARYELGDISKLEWLGLRLELAAGDLARLDARVKARRAAADLEDVLQSPIDGEGWVLKTPARSAGTAKERDR